MKKALFFILPLCLLIACNHPIPAPDTTLGKSFNKGYFTFYGAHYGTNNVLSLDLYSPTISFNDSTGRIEGNGWNLYFSDIFISPQDTLPPAGLYSQDTTATPFTFLPSMNYEGQYSGCYLIRIVDGAWDNTIYLFEDGHFNLQYVGDTACFTFTMKTQPTATERTKEYVAEAKGIFPIYSGL